MSRSIGKLEPRPVLSTIESSYVSNRSVLPFTYLCVDQKIEPTDCHYTTATCPYERAVGAQEAELKLRSSKSRYISF